MRRLRPLVMCHAEARDYTGQLSVGFQETSVAMLMMFDRAIGW
jgi:hypothetical protein